MHITRITAEACVKHKAQGLKSTLQTLINFGLVALTFLKVLWLFLLIRTFFSALQKLLVFTILHLFLTIYAPKSKKKTDFFHLKEQHLFVMQQY